MYAAASTDAGGTPLPEAMPTPRADSRFRTSPGQKFKSRAARRKPKPADISASPRSCPKPNPTKIESPKPTKVGPVDGEILIAVMGVTGSGKSYFCRSATGNDDIVVGDGVQSCNAADTAVKCIYAD
jgi:hypothetical protein